MEEYPFSDAPVLWPRSIGIYGMKNVNTGVVYVGRTIHEKGFRHRWLTHRSELNNNKHDNTYLQNSYNRHGVENFVVFVIEICGSDIILERENYWIQYYNNLLNGKIYNIVQIETTSIKRTTSFPGKDFELIDPDGNYIKGNNLAHLCREKKLEYASMLSLLKGEYLQSQGYVLANSDFRIPEYRIISPTGELFITKDPSKFLQEQGVIGKNADSSPLILGICPHMKGWHLENISSENRVKLDNYIKAKSKTRHIIINSVIYSFNNISLFAKKYNLPKQKFMSFIGGANVKENKTSRDKKWKIPNSDDFLNLPLIKEDF